MRSTSSTRMCRWSGRGCTVMPAQPASTATRAATTGSGHACPRELRSTATLLTLTLRAVTRHPGFGDSQKHKGPAGRLHPASGPTIRILQWINAGFGSSEGALPNRESPTPRALLPARLRHLLPGDRLPVRAATRVVALFGDQACGDEGRRVGSDVDRQRLVALRRGT